MHVVSAADVRPKAMPLLWRGRIPANALTVIAGRPGMGKSTLECLIAKELSRERIPGLILNAEDDPESVTLPRLQAAGAKLELVSLSPADADIRFPRDYELLRGLILEHGARYVIVDPIEAHFVPKQRCHDRPTLGELVRIARETQCAVIAMHHQTKTSMDGDPLSRIGGPSSGLAGTARAAYLYGFDPEDVDRRALACVKINGIEKPPTLLIEHHVKEFTAGDVMLEAGVLRVVGESNADGSAVLRPGKKFKQRDAEANEWLSSFLATAPDCRRQVSEIRREATAIGYAWLTMTRARVAIKAETMRFGEGVDGFDMWRLPDEHPLRDGVVEMV